MDIAFLDQGGPDLGAKCHQRRQAAVPAWVVTDMTGEIIISNRVNYQVASSNSWVLTSGRLTITRFWSASTAMIVCTMQNESRDEDYPDLPGYVYRAVLPGRDNFKVTPPPLDKNDEICVWCGYIDAIRPVVTLDLQDGSLIRCFVGVIDTIVASGTSNMGTTMMIQCRDRMKYLMDSLGTYNTTDFNYIRDGKPGEGTELRRPQVIMEVAKRSIGNLENAKSTENEKRCGSVCGMVVEEGYVEDLSTEMTAAPKPADDGGFFDFLPGFGKSEDKAPSTEDLVKQVPFLERALPKLDTAIKVANDALFKIAIPTGDDGYEYRRIEKQIIDLTSELNSNDPDNIYLTITDTPEANKFKEIFDNNIKPFNERASAAKNYLNYIRESYITKATEQVKEVPSSAGATNSTSSPGGTTNTSADAESVYKPGNGRNYYGSSKPPFIGGSVTTPTLGIEAKNPKFNIITGRLPFDVNEQSFFGMANQVTDRIALEFIKFLALQEPWPTEVFMDHRSGEFWYAPRELDLSGLDDPQRFYRTYVYRNDSTKYLSDINKSRYVHPCQAMLLFREESSSINWRSNIIVANQIGGESGKSIGVHLKVVPPWLRGRRFACTYYTITDKTIQAEYELVGTAMAFARLYGKELRAATMHVIGDPSMVPGEAVQVLGSPLNQTTKEKLEKDKANAKEQYVDKYKATATALTELSKAPPVEQPPTDSASTTSTAPSASASTAPTAPPVSEGAGSVTTESEREANPNLGLSDIQRARLSGNEKIITSYIDSPSTSTPAALRARLEIALSIFIGVDELPESVKRILADGSEKTIDEYRQSLKDNLYTVKPPAPTPTTPSTGTTSPQEDETEKQITPESARPTVQNLADSMQYSATMMCPYLFGGGEGNIGRLDAEEPPSIWRIEAIIHKFNENPGDGFKTEVALLAPT